MPEFDPIWAIAGMITHERWYDFALTFGEVTGPFEQDRTMPGSKSMKSTRYKALAIFTDSTANIEANYDMPVVRPLRQSSLLAVAVKYTNAQPDKPAKLHVTFVCTGNICRSPMTEAMFANQLRQRGLGDAVRVSSAGTRAHGLIADPRTERVLQRHGYSYAHGATRLGQDHLDADLVVEMAGQHAWNLAHDGVPTERPRLLRTFDPSNPSRVDVDDPFYSGDFESTFATIAAALPGLHRRVDDRLASNATKPHTVVRGGCPTGVSI